MRTLFIWVSVWTLIYVQWRFGLTLNRLFVITFLLGVLASLYSFLWFVGAVFVSMKSPKLLKRPLKYHRKKWFISMLVTAVAFYGFYRTQLPGQFEAYKAIAGEKMDELLDHDKKHSKTEEEEVITYNTEQREKLIDETSLEAMKMAGNDFNLQETIREITTGWNMETTDTEFDEINWNKATDLVKKYPDYIHNAEENWISASKVLERPQKYYGKVVNFSGKIYSVEQLPPEDSVAEFFDGTCYRAMLAVKDKNKPVMISVYIIGTSDDVEEDSVVNVKGFVYGHSKLVTGRGDSTNGLAFVGFRE